MPIDKSMSTGEIIKKEKAAGKPQDQAVAIALSVKGKSKNADLSWRDRMNTLQERAARGTQRYASKKNEDDVEDISEQRTGDENLEGHGLLKKNEGVEKSLAMQIVDEIRADQITEQACINYAKSVGYRTSDGQKAWQIIFREMRNNEIEEDRGFQNEDEASQEEHEIQESEIERKEEMTPKGNSLVVRAVKNGLVKEKYCTYCEMTTNVDEHQDGKQTCSECGKEYKS